MDALQSNTIFSCEFPWFFYLSFLPLVGRGLAMYLVLETTQWQTAQHSAYFSSVQWRLICHG